MGNLSPVISNIFVGIFEGLALDTVQHKPLLLVQYVDNTFVV
jgi:hypothetical protein